MSAVYQSSSVTNLASTSSLVISKPSGVIDGDLMVAVIHLTFNSGAQTFTPASGWTLIRSDTAGGAGAPVTIKSYYKVASSEGADYTWGISGGASTAGGSILRITDFNTVTPVLASNGAGTNSGSATNLTFADTVTPTDGYQLILFPVYASAGTGTMSTYAVTTSNPTWTELYDNNSAGNCIMSLAYATRDEATATGNSSVTCTDTVEQWVAQKIVINRVYAFSSTISETVTCTDTHVNNVGFNLTVSETVTPTDTHTAVKEKTWATQNKSSTTWINQDKS